MFLCYPKSPEKSLRFRQFLIFVKKILMFSLSLSLTLKFSLYPWGLGILSSSVLPRSNFW